MQLSTDTVICFDVSGSMEAKDFTPNRLEAAKSVVIDFIEKMESNRMAIVLFSGFAFTQSPLTFDTEILKNLLRDVKIGMVRISGTAIGSALGVALNRFKSKDISKQKVIVLLTDGENNRGLSPMKYAEMAKKAGVKIYTIGMGTPEGYSFSQRGPFGRTYSQKTTLNEELLRKIAKMTGGKYYYGSNENELKKAYREIAELEKKKVKTIKKRVFYPRYRLITLILLIFLIFEVFVIWRKEFIYL